MKFKKWVEKRGPTAAAEELGIGRCTLYYWLRGKHFPGFKESMRIVKVTKIPLGVLMAELQANALTFKGERK